MTKPSFALREMPKGRALVFDAPGCLVQIEFNTATGTWCAVELNEWGGFRRRLYDGRESSN